MHLNKVGEIGNLDRDKSQTVTSPDYRHTLKLTGLGSMVFLFLVEKSHRKKIVCLLACLCVRTGKKNIHSVDDYCYPLTVGI